MVKINKDFKNLVTHKKDVLRKRLYIGFYE